MKINVEVPTRLSSAQKNKLQEFAAACDEQVNPISAGFFEKAKRWFR